MVGDSDDRGIRDVWLWVKPYRHWLGWFCAVSAASVVLALAALWVGTGFSGLGVSGRGLVAVILGVVATVGLAIGLMALIFLSNRSGYDEDRYLQQGRDADTKQGGSGEEAAPPSAGAGES